MKSFIVAVPLFDADMGVVAYRMNTQNGEKLFGVANDYTSMGDAMNSIGLESISQIGVEPFTGGKPIFVECNEYNLMMDLPQRSNVPPELLVCVISRKTRLDAAVLGKCRQLKELGYSIALDNIRYSMDVNEFYDLADYVLIDSLLPSLNNLIINARLRNRRQKIVLTGIPNQEAFEKLSRIPYTLFGGHFYSEPITKGSKLISALKVNALQLLKVVSEDDFDLYEASDVIQRDVAISISLLRFINSPAVGLTRTIDSIKAAVAILGQRETKKWVIVTISSKLADDKPTEITKLSLVRAKFAENLATAFNLGVLAPSLFMMGLFSLLDVILDKPMSEAITEISVNGRIRSALVDHEGELYDVLRLIYDYEHADWEAVSTTMIRKGIEVEQINKAFLDALVWYKLLLEGVFEEEPAIEAESKSV